MTKVTTATIVRDDSAGGGTAAAEPAPAIGRDRVRLARLAARLRRGVLPDPHHDLPVHADDDSASCDRSSGHGQFQGRSPQSGPQDNRHA